MKNETYKYMINGPKGKEFNINTMIPCEESAEMYMPSGNGNCQKEQGKIMEDEDSYYYEGVYRTDKSRHVFVPSKFFNGRVVSKINTDERNKYKYTAMCGYTPTTVRFVKSKNKSYTIAQVTNVIDDSNGKTDQYFKGNTNIMGYVKDEEGIYVITAYDVNYSKRDCKGNIEVNFYTYGQIRKAGFTEDEFTNMIVDPDDNTREVDHSKSTMKYYMVNRQTGYQSEVSEWYYHMMSPHHDPYVYYTTGYDVRDRRIKEYKPNNIKEIMYDRYVEPIRTSTIESDDMFETFNRIAKGVHDKGASFFNRVEQNIKASQNEENETNKEQFFKEMMGKYTPEQMDAIIEFMTFMNNKSNSREDSPKQYRK